MHNLLQHFRRLAYGLVVLALLVVCLVMYGLALPWLLVLLNMGAR